MKEITEEDRRKALEVFKNTDDSKLVTHLNSCVHCGLCAESCLYYLATGDDRFIPARKVDLVASIYRRYCTLTGRVVPALTGARDLDEKTVEEMVDLLFGGCTVCNRCTLHCSIGVDIGYVVAKGRQMLSVMGMVPATLQSTVDTALNTGNNMGISEQELIDTLKWLEEDLRDDLGDPTVTIPINETGKRILYTINPREPKFFPLTISAMAKIFHAAKESWTISTKMYDVTNYAYFTGNTEEMEVIARRTHDEMLRLKAGMLVLGECGHGSRALRWEAPNYMKLTPPYPILTCSELLAGYVTEGRIRLDRSRLRKKVTLHDPCNLVRNGGVVKELRTIVKAAASDFTEMTPHGIDNFCCGGGGGQLAMSEYNERRMKAGSVKAQQIKKTGAEIVVTPCHNCVDQLTQTNIAYKLNVQIKTLTEIVADALL